MHLREVLNGSSKADIDIAIDVDVKVGVDIDRYFGRGFQS